MAHITTIGLALLSLGTAAAAQAQDIFHDAATGTLVKGGTTCVGPLSPSDAGGVEFVGSTDGPADLTWQVYSVSSQSAPAQVFSAVGPAVDVVIPPSGNLLYYGCAGRAPRAGQAFDVALFSGTQGTPAHPAVEQQHAFGTILKGMSVCTDEVAPTAADGDQIFGFTNGFEPLNWRVVSVDAAGATAVAFARTATFVDHTVPPSPGLVYRACVGRGPASAEDFDLSLNSTTIE
jgi:hypothetical protein